VLRLRCGGIFSDITITNFLLIDGEKKFEKWSNEVVRRTKMFQFFATLYIPFATTALSRRACSLETSFTESTNCSSQHQHYLLFILLLSIRVLRFVAARGVTSHSRRICYELLCHQRKTTALIRAHTVARQ